MDTKNICQERSFIVACLFQDVFLEIFLKLKLVTCSKEYSLTVLVEQKIAILLYIRVSRIEILSCMCLAHLDPREWMFFKFELFFKEKHVFLNFLTLCLVSYQVENP